MGPSPTEGAAATRPPRRIFLVLALVVSLPVLAHGLLTLARPPLSVLCFHAVGEHPPDPWTVPVDRFEALLDAVTASGLPVTSLEAVERGGPGGVLLSFDDGRTSHLDRVAPALAVRRWQGLFLLPTGPGVSALPPAAIRSLVDAGHGIGAHSRSHRSLLPGPAEPEAAYRSRLESEIAGSRRDLEALLGRPVRSFAYPLGDFTPGVRKAVAEAGYTSAFTVDLGHHSPSDDPLEIPRYLVTAETRPDQIRDFLAGPATTARLQVLVAGCLALAALLGLLRSRAGDPSRAP